MPSLHTSPHLPWSSRRPQLASPLTNEIVGKVECGSASGVVTEREGGHLANGARGITIFAVPYDSGHRALRMGAGPEHLLSNGVEGVLAATGREIRSEVLQPTSTFRAEIAPRSRPPSSCVG
jgi:hypothetical protein